MRKELRRRAQVAGRYKVRFDRSLILTGPDDPSDGVVLPAFRLTSRPPSALSRLLAFLELLLLVVLWGGGTAIAIAGAAWAVTRIV
jgi:hypothetical protein